MGVKEKIFRNPELKKKLYALLMSKYDYRPRLWFRMLALPFVYSKGKHSKIRRSVRLDLLPNNKCLIGSKTIIESHSVINNAVGDVLIGNETIIGFSNIIIGPVTIGNKVMLAQHVVLSGLNHNYEDVSLAPKDQGVSTEEIMVGDNVWIGANAVITAGVKIGKHAIIGAGSVVTKDVPAFSIAVGSPARIIKKYDFQDRQWKRV
ncbi:MAG: acyltransferase [Niabella sp.]